MARLKNISRAREKFLALSTWKDHRSQLAARPRIIQRVLAGRRQWIATTDFAGCPGRPLDSFANGAVLTTPAKFLIGWAGPSPRAFLCRLTPERNSFSPPVADGRCRSATIRRPLSPLPPSATSCAVVGTRRWLMCPWPAGPLKSTASTPRPEPSAILMRKSAAWPSTAWSKNCWPAAAPTWKTLQPPSASYAVASPTSSRNSLPS